MTICREWLLTHEHQEGAEAKLLTCRSWNCDYCQPDRKRKLFAQAASGEPTRFVTLTINPAVGDGPDERLRILSYSWRIIVKRLRRLFPGREVEYFAVCEETKHGEPHLHILLRSPYVAQSFLADAMAELAQSPIVDIRRIRGVAQAVRYVAKYIQKKPAQFGTSKRYWHSSKYFLTSEGDEQWQPANRKDWRVWRDSAANLLRHWVENGYAPRRDGELGLVAVTVHADSVASYLRRRGLHLPEPEPGGKPDPFLQAVLALELEKPRLSEHTRK